MTADNPGGLYSRQTRRRNLLVSKYYLYIPTSHERNNKGLLTTKVFSGSHRLNFSNSRVDVVVVVVTTFLLNGVDERYFYFS